MGRRRKYRQAEGSSAAGWDRVLTDMVNGRHLVPGTAFSVWGERGRFSYQHTTTTPAGRVWVDGIGGPKGTRSHRSFRPDRIRRVHWKAKP